MPLRWHVNLPGPVVYSRPMRKKRAGSGPLTTVLVWFIVKPLELIFKGMAKLFRIRPRPKVAQPAPYNGVPGWYNTVHGPLYFSGANWYAPDGRAIF